MSQALMDAMQANDVATLRSIIARQPHLVNFRDDQGDSPVLRAIYYGAHDAAQLLISEGAQLNVHEAAAVGDVVRVQDALSADPTALNSLSHDGWTPLHLASFFGHEDVARLLISRGADIHAVSTNRMETCRFTRRPRTARPPSCGYCSNTGPMSTRAPEAGPRSTWRWRTATRSLSRCCSHVELTLTPALATANRP